MKKGGHGVGFAIRNTLLGFIMIPSNCSERMLKIQLLTAMGLVILFSIYAPMMNSAPEENNEFYDDMEAAINDVPEQQLFYILGNSNARVGSDSASWPVCLGQYDIGKLNDNREGLLEFCTAHHLCVTNIFICLKSIHCVSWRHPRSKHWHQLDPVLMWNKSIGDVKLTWCFQSADCDTEHSLVCSTVRLKPRKLKGPEWVKKHIDKTTPTAWKMWRSSTTHFRQNLQVH